ncbi:MAG TPA: hypothetical protein VIJ27_13805, partial [Mucilaginibacter sp.]
PKFVLQNIGLSFICSNTLQFSILSPKLNIEVLYIKAKGLEDWLDVKVSRENSAINIVLNLEAATRLE